MLHWIVSSSLRMRLILVSLAALLLIGGMWRMRNASLDVVPEFSRLSLEVQTEALGLSSSEVESLITVPLEADLLNGVPWLQSIESESITGLSSIEMFFVPGTDLMRARQMVQERLTQAHALPNVSSPPVLLQPVSSASRIMNVGLSSKTVSLIDMSVLARWTIVPRLVGVPGVANVSVWGQRNRQVQVQVDPATLHSKGVTLEQIVKTAGEAVWASPLTYLNSSTPGSGGFIDTPNQRLGVRHVSPTATPESFGKVPVHGTSLALHEVTKVVEDNQPLIGSAILKNGMGLMLVVEKFPGSNTADVTRGVEAALRELSPGMKGIDIDTNIYRPASFIERATKNLTIGALASYVLILLGLGVLLGNWRAAVVTAIVIPLSLISAAWVFHLRGANLDMMLIAGLMLATAVIVDDAILDVENIANRLRLARANKHDADGLMRTLVLAAMEVRGPMMFATVIIVLAAAPMLFIQGPAADFFQPLVWAYITAVLTSLAVALTLTPVLCMLLLPKDAAAPERKVTRLMQMITRGAGRLSGASMRTPLPALSLAVAGLAVGVLTWKTTEHSFVPGFKETDVVVALQAAPGTSLPETNRLTSAVMQDLMKINGVRNVAAHVGRAVLSNEVADVDSAEAWVSMDPNADYKRTLQAINDTVATYPGIRAEVDTFLSTRMREVLTGDDERVSVRVYGHDQDILRSKAKEIKEVLAKIDGVTNPHVETQAEKTTIEVKVVLDKAKSHGLKPGDVRRAASSLVSGITVGALFQDQKVFDVVVLGSPGIRDNLAKVRDLLIDTPSGGQVRLADVADVRTISSPSVIRRQGVSRRIDIDADVAGADLAAVSREVATRIKDVSFPFEYHAQVLGEHFSQKAALQSLPNYVLAAVLVVFLIVQAALGSWRLAAVAALGLPIALLGGFLAVAVNAGGFTLGSVLGFVAVTGLAVRHGMVLVRHFQALASQGLPFGPELIERGVSEKTPALMTSTILIALMMLPFVVMGNVAGLEIVHPMAGVVMGSLISTVLLSLVCIPALYLRFGTPVAQEQDLLSQRPLPLSGVPPVRVVEAA